MPSHLGRQCTHRVQTAVAFEYLLPSEYSMPSPGEWYALTWSIECPPLSIDCPPLSIDCSHPSIYCPQSIVCPLLEYKLLFPKMVPFFGVLDLAFVHGITWYLVDQLIISYIFSLIPFQIFWAIWFFLQSCVCEVPGFRGFVLGNNVWCVLEWNQSDSDHIWRC